MQSHPFLPPWKLPPQQTGIINGLVCVFKEQTQVTSVGCRNTPLQNRAHLCGMKLHFLEIAEHKTKTLNTKKHPSRQNRVKTQLYSFEITLHVENGAQTWDRRAAHWALLARCLPTSNFLCFLHQLFAMQPPHERTPTQQFLSQTGTVSSMQERLGQGNRTD